VANSVMELAKFVNIKINLKAGCSEKNIISILWVVNECEKKRGVGGRRRKREGEGMNVREGVCLCVCMCVCVCARVNV
jgi:hypothetical protein